MAHEKIFIVEDESIVAMEMTERLTHLGYEVIGHAKSGQQALKRVGQSVPDLVLMDILLKGDMDGIQTTEQIRSRFDIPVVYVTAHADAATLERAKITQPFGYIIKPFNERELHTTIEIALYKHQMEKRLREREQWLATTLESIGDAVITTDCSSHITFMNPVAQHTTGWALPDAVGKDIVNVFNIMREEAVDVAHKLTERVMREAVLILANGTELPVEYTASPIKGEGGGVAGIVVVFRDISERKRAEEALRQTKVYAENLIATANVMIVSLDSAGCTRVFNEAAEKITGYTKAELENKNWLDVLAPEGRCPHLRETLHGWKKGELELRSKSSEAPIITKSGEERLISWRHCEVRDGEHVVGLISCGVDSIEAEAVEVPPQDGNKRQTTEQLACEVAHDFNNILTTIACYGHLLNMQVKGDASLTTYVDRILDSSGRAALLVKSLFRSPRNEPGNPNMTGLSAFARQPEER
jgi:PAS domain S-box-containing protein